MGKAISCSFRISSNFWNYYFVKWGIKKKSFLILNIAPDSIVLDLNKDDIKYKKGLLKVIFNLVKQSRIKYYKDRDKMVIYSKNKKFRKECSLNIMAAEIIETVLNLGRDFREYNDQFFLIEIIKGAKFLIRKNAISDICTLEEIFIKNEWSFLYPYIKGSVVLDIGTYIGDTAILFCIKEAKKVFAYEPFPLFYNISLKNIKLNNLEERIEIKNCGIGEKDAVLDIKEGESLSSFTAFTLKKYPHAKEVQIKIISFSKIIENMEKIDVLKMDCEGAEFPAILSCSPSSLRKIKVMGIEYHNDPLPLIEHLNKAGFNVEIKREDKKADEWSGLLFAISKEKRLEI